MQINRLFEIIYILLDKKTVTSKELSKRFEVSTRTIFRDIETLSAAGIPVYMSKGKGGGISLLPEFILNKTVLTEDEKDNILASLKAVHAVSFRENDTALNKLGSLFGESDTDWIEVDFSYWANAKNEKDLFNELRTSIRSKKRVTFSYASGKGKTTVRVVEPLKLCFKSSAWYLYGYCKMRCDYRFFKLRRIKNLSGLEERFLRQSPGQIFNEKEVFQDELIELKMKLSPQMAYRVYDEFDSYEEQTDGSFIATIRYPKGEWIIYYVASFGEFAEVLEPESIRNDMKIKLKKMLNSYL